MSETIQVLCVWWGTSYTAADVNRLHRNVRDRSASPIRFVAITEHASPELDEGIEQIRFPGFVLPFELMKKGARAKLSVFKQGLLDPDLPAIFLDLDTAIFGDVRRLADELDRHPGNIHMVQNAMLPLWRVQRLARPFIGNRHYYANSSIMVFRPRERAFIFDAFNATLLSGIDPGARILRTDDRFISDKCRDQVRVLPNTLAVKFTEEFMLPHPAMEDFRSKLPGVAARRENLVAVTFNGFMPLQLAALRVGDILERRGLKRRWTDTKYSDYWR